MNVGELLRFGAVGLLQNATNLATFAVMTAVGTGYLIAAGAASAVALVASYAMNRRWTFAIAAKRDRAEFVRYAMVFVAAVGVGAAILAVLVEVAHWPAVAAQAAAIVIVAPASYLAQRTFSFRVDA